MKIASLVISIWQLVARYPALTAGIFNVIIIAGAAVGLHLTNSELAATAGFIAALTALVIHSGVIPTAKVDNVKAGLKPTVPSGLTLATAVAETPLAVNPVLGAADPVPVEIVHDAITTIEANTILSAGNRFRVI